MRFEQGAPAGVKPVVPMVQSSRDDRALSLVAPVTVATSGSTGSIALLPRQSELRSYLRELAATRR